MNDRTMLQIRRKMYSQILGVDLPDCEDEEELEIIYQQMRPGVMASLMCQGKRAAAEAYVTDPPLVTAIIQTEVSIDWEECVSIASLEHQSVCTGCLTVVGSYEQSVVSSIPAVYSEMSHGSHPKFGVTISGSEYRGCEIECQDTCFQKCTVNGHSQSSEPKSEVSLMELYPTPNGVNESRQLDFLPVWGDKSECIPPTSYNSDKGRCICAFKVKHYKVYYSGSFPDGQIDTLPREVKCICYDKCSYALDFKSSVLELKSMRSRLNYELAECVRQTLPIEVTTMIEGYLSCREKMMLAMHDGIGREGCYLRHNLLKEGSGPTMLPRCICSTVAYRYPQFVRPFPIVGDPGCVRKRPPWHIKLKRELLVPP